MLRTTVKFLLCLLSVLWIHSSQDVTAQAQPIDEAAAIERLLSTLSPSTTDQIQQSQKKCFDRIDELNAELDRLPTGAILRREFQLVSIVEQLKLATPDIALLDKSVAVLRKPIPGKLQQYTHQLEESLSHLVKLLRCSESSVPAVRESLEILGQHAANKTLRNTAEGASQLREAFALVANVHPNIDAVHDLQNRLSHDNTITLVRRRLIEKESNGSFHTPVNQRVNKEQTSIHTTGDFIVSYRAELPLSDHDCTLVLHVAGNGKLNADAQRNKASIDAIVNPSIRGSQLLHIQPKAIAGNSPNIKASLDTVVTQARIDCPLGKLPITQRLVTRIVQRKLDENAPVLANQIENDIRKKTEEVGYQLAYRINGLLRHTIWDRFHFLTFEPQISLSNNQQGIFYSAKYTMHHQLAALSPPPEIPAEIKDSLDVITYVHESAITNVLSDLPAFSLDEATIRGVWQVQLKMEHPSWNKPQPAKISSLVHLRTPKPLSISLDHNAVIIDLHVDSYRIDDSPEQTSPCDVRLTYKVQQLENKIHLLRSALEFPTQIPLQQQNSWIKVLDRFFPDELHPLQQYRQSGLSSVLKLRHLRLENGWLVTGLSRQDSTNLSSSSSAKDSQ